MASGGAGSLMHAVAAAAMSIIGPQASDEVQAQRRAVCEDCPLYTLTKVGPTCGQFTMAVRSGGAAKTEGCGCFLDVKTKGQDNKCPQGKW